eukprot:scaffold423421_cov126-Attheya_sp.AAC.1
MVVDRPFVSGNRSDERFSEASGYLFSHGPKYSVSEDLAVANLLRSVGSNTIRPFGLDFKYPRTDRIAL